MTKDATLESKDALSARSRPARRKPSQLVELLLHVAEQLGYASDREVAELADVSPENVANWRSGAVQELKPKKLEGVKLALTRQLVALKEQAGEVHEGFVPSVTNLEIEDGSSPTDLQRQFRDRVLYDYLGHRFLYYEPMGALAWENLIKRGYEQSAWINGVEVCARAWLDEDKDPRGGSSRGPIASALGFGRRSSAIAGLDLISLGPGEGDKELVVLERVLELEQRSGRHTSWLAYCPVDVSIPLLMSAAKRSRQLLSRRESQRARGSHVVKPFCADFEEGGLGFVDRLPTEFRPDRPGVRLILMLGNTFGNLRDEEAFVREKLWRLTRRHDLVWIEVGLRPDSIEDDPLFRLTQPDREVTAAEANRRLLLEGPYRRWEVATGRAPGDLEMRVWIREDDDACRVPGSTNFCHDLVIKDERRVCTMLYSRRYALEELRRWFAQLGFSVLRAHAVEDSKRRPRVAHLLLERSE